MDPKTFAVLLRQTGLDPADHDLDELRGAYLRLQELLSRLDPGDREAEMLAVFDPGRPL